VQRGAALESRTPLQPNYLMPCYCCTATGAPLLRWFYCAQAQFGGQAQRSPQPHVLPQQQRAVTARSEFASRVPQDVQVHAAAEHGEHEQAFVIWMVMAYLDGRVGVPTYRGPCGPPYALSRGSRSSLIVRYACSPAAD